jgi:glyoxylase-like metal-dependent hydrolase (beta-lactamase superfamily II)
MCCHCLLIEGEDGLILVDTGLGVEDVANPSRLGFLFNAALRPRLEIAETALRQVADLGFRTADVRHIVPTHLDLDHAGGLADFPSAKVHVFAPELRAALDPRTFRERNRYRAAQLSDVTKWAPVEEDGGDWSGFASVRAIPGARDDVLLIPLAGHSRGHCGVAVRTSRGWLLHCGDAYFHHTEVAPQGGRTPPGLKWVESFVNVDRLARIANQQRLRDLARSRPDEVRLICSHDPTEFAACRRSEPYGAEESAPSSQSNERQLNKLRAPASQWAPAPSATRKR